MAVRCATVVRNEASRESCEQDDARPDEADLSMMLGGGRFLTWASSSDLLGIGFLEVGGVLRGGVGGADAEPRGWRSEDLTVSLMTRERKYSNKAEKESVAFKTRNGIAVAVGTLDVGCWLVVVAGSQLAVDECQWALSNRTGRRLLVGW